MPANNQGIMHFRTGSRVWCGNYRGHMATSDPEQFDRELKPCKKCKAKLEASRRSTKSAADLYKKGQSIVQEFREGSRQ